MAPGAKGEEPEASRQPDPPAGGLDMPAAPPPLEVEAFPGESQLAEDERARQLVLHMALPRTIMTWDIAENRSTEEELNRALAEMAWGTLDTDRGDWLLESEGPTLEPPDPTQISYAEYMARAFPSDASREAEERERNASAAAAKLAVFTSPGEPGASFRPLFETMVKSLAHSNKTLAKAYEIRKAILNEAEVPEDPSKSEAQAIMRYGRHQVLPSFWQLLIHLTKRNRRFSLVLRSFSREQLALMQRELQLFCQGQHPAYSGQNKTQKPPPMNGEKGSRDMRLTDLSIGSTDRGNGRLEFAEAAAAAAAVAAAQAAGEAAQDATAAGATAADAPAPAAQPPRPSFYPFPPFHEAYAGLQEHVLEAANTAAIVDDFEYFKANDRQNTAGKLLLVDHSGGFAETKVQHIFFDGNIGREDGGCVDVRDVVSGEPTPFEEASGVFLHRVDLFQAATDIDYFVKALEGCELEMSKRILKSRRVTEEAAQCAAEAPSPQLPPKDYLYQNIIPALLPALQACQRDRPEDPIEFIAFYMLRHSTMYNKTLKG